MLALGCNPGPDRDPDEAPVQVALPDSPAEVDDLTAILTTSGNPAKATFSWTVDGQPTSWDGPTVPASEVRRGQTWEVTVQLGEHDARATTEVSRLGGNVLVLLVDDLGIDRVGAYGVHPEVPPTPTIDQLAADGLLFRNAWVQPTCSPTRASLVTGRYPRRTGVGRWIMPPDQRLGIDFDEVMIPEMLAEGPVHYDDSYVGKWHLTGYANNPDPGSDPLAAGWTWYAGTLGNPDNSVMGSGGQNKGYAYYEKADNGDLFFSEYYLTSDTTDDAIARLEAMREPWVMVVAYNAPHTPLHVPPAHLHDYDLDPNIASDRDKYDAMVQALDTEMGRLLDAVDPEVRGRTTVVFLSDNGTPDHGTRPPTDPTRVKGTVYEGGVNVPMIVTGPAVATPGGETLAMVESVDLFHTVAEIAGVDLADVIDPRTNDPVITDGTSFLPVLEDPGATVRERAYTSKHFPNGEPPYAWEQDAIRDEQYKLAYSTELGFWFFEYLAPFDEGPELLALGPLTPEQQEAYDRLETELFEQIADLPFGP